MPDWPSSLIAVTGTLLGVTLAHAFQLRQTSRSERAAMVERRRVERIDALRDFVSAMTQLRRSLITLWFDRQKDKSDQSFDKIAEGFLDADTRGAMADAARFRVELVTSDRRILDLMEPIFVSMTAIAAASDRGELREREKQSQELLSRFLDVSRAHLKER